MKIAIVEPLGISEQTAENLKKSSVGEGLEMVYYNTPPKDDAEKAERAKDAEIVMLANMPFGANVLEKCPKLKLLSVAFTGVDHVGMDYCKAHGITVCNCSGYANEAVSELVIGMAISLYRQLSAMDAAVRGGKTRTVGYELSGKNFGIVGLGAIGRKTAELARAFGCKVYAYSRSPKNVEGIAEVSLDELLSISDILSLHVPLTKDTQGLINKGNIGRMKKTAILINAARGPVVDSAALADALKSGNLAGAAIDVFEHEPPIEADHVLFNAPNVIAAPHIGFATHEALEKRAVIAFENIKQWQAGTPQNVM